MRRYAVTLALALLTAVSAVLFAIVIVQGLWLQDLQRDLDLLHSQTRVIRTFEDGSGLDCRRDVIGTEVHLNDCRKLHVPW